MPSSPSARRVASLIWFPFFFVAAFAMMGIFAFSHPTPHHVAVAVVGSSSEVRAVQGALDDVVPNGFDLRSSATLRTARAAVADNDVAAAFTTGDGHAQILVAPAASASRATYVTSIFNTVAAQNGDTIRRVDVVPLASGDVSGVSLMFVGLPLMLVGLITALVLLQFGPWTLRAKAITVAAAGAFASIFVYLLGTALDVIPADEWLLLYGFMLTQAIGWIAVGAAAFTRQFFMPVIMTFVLVLALPTSGATVAGNMLPTPLAWLSEVLPFAQWVDIARASAYFGGRHLAWPLILLAVWMLIGAALMVGSALLARRAHDRAVSAMQYNVVADAHDAAPYGAATTGRVHGTVTLSDNQPVVSGLVLVLGQRGDEIARAATDDDGHFAIDDVSTGLRTLLVTAPHCDPVVATIDVHEGPTAPSRRVVLFGWDDPSGNLAVAGTSATDMLVPLDGRHHAAHRAR